MSNEQSVLNEVENYKNNPAKPANEALMDKSLEATFNEDEEVLRELQNTQDTHDQQQQQHQNADHSALLKNDTKFQQGLYLEDQVALLSAQYNQLHNQIANNSMAIAIIWQRLKKENEEDIFTQAAKMVAQVNKQNASINNEKGDVA